jgi:hypothetical protein
MQREGMKEKRAGSADTTAYKQSISTQLDPTRLVVISTSPGEYSIIVHGQSNK